MSIVVFYVTHHDSIGNPTGYAMPKCIEFNDSQMGIALETCQTLRTEGMQHVTISTQLSDCVSKSGVSSVEDGKLPDGSDYTWKMRRNNERPVDPK